MYTKRNKQSKGKKTAGGVKEHHETGGTRKLNWLLKSDNGLLDCTERQNKWDIRMKRCSYGGAGTEKRN